MRSKIPSSESFDIVLSTFGVMFAPQPRRSAAEMLRVCRAGGRIGPANRTPDSFIDQLFKTVDRHVLPPAGLDSPLLWGTRARIDELFGPDAASIVATTRQFMFRYRSAQHGIDVFCRFYGPVLRAFDALPPASLKALSADLLELLARFNRSADSTFVAPSDCLEVGVTRAWSAPRTLLPCNRG